MHQILKSCSARSQAGRYSTCRSKTNATAIPGALATQDSNIYTAGCSTYRFFAAWAFRVLVLTVPRMFASPPSRFSPGTCSRASQSAHGACICLAQATGATGERGPNEVTQVASAVQLVADLLSTSCSPADLTLECTTTHSSHGIAAQGRQAGEGRHTGAFTCSLEAVQPWKPPEITKALAKPRFASSFATSLEAPLPFLSRSRILAVSYTHLTLPTTPYV